MAGDVIWLSESEFKVAHQIWIGPPGQNGIETEGWDMGTFQHERGSHLHWEIDPSHSLFSWLGITHPIIDKFDLWIDGEDQTITDNVLTYGGGSVTVNGTGWVTINGGWFTKSVRITPEPGSLLLLAVGGLVALRRRRVQHA